MNATSQIFATMDYESADSNYRTISISIAWLILILCVIGIMGNIMSLIIYCDARMRSPINVLLAGLSFIDLCLSIFSVPTFVVPGMYAYYGSSNLRSIMSYTTIYIYPLTLTLQTASIWVFVLITFERWQTVCRPKVNCARYLCRTSSIKRSILAVLLICSFSAFYNAIRFFEFKLDYPSMQTNCTELDYDHDHIQVVAVLRNSTAYPLYMNVYYIGMFLITHFVIPFTILVILNGYIIATICRSRKRRRLLNQKERSEHRTATMMIIVVITFIICYALLFALNIMEAIDAQWFYEIENMVLAFALNDISNLLIVTNASSTIVVYWFFSGKYRFMLISLIMRLLPCIDSTSILDARKKSMYEEEDVPRKFNAREGVRALMVIINRTNDSRKSLFRKNTVVRTDTVVTDCVL